eukprot:scaffold8200_cov277-Pinguiococcus_pyrenoidosus.AAC.5
MLVRGLDQTREGTPWMATLAKQNDACSCSQWLLAGQRPATRVALMKRVAPDEKGFKNQKNKNRRNQQERTNASLARFALRIFGRGFLRVSPHENRCKRLGQERRIRVPRSEAFTRHTEMSLARLPAFRPRIFPAVFSALRRSRRALPCALATPTHARALSSDIQRFETADPRMSQMVVHNGLVYLSGQVPKDFGAPLEEQVRSTLDKVDALLAQAGTSKAKMISAMIWLKSMDDFAAMNAIWSDYLDPDNKPVRACVEAPMAHKDILFEVMVVAAQ